MIGRERPLFLLITADGSIQYSRQRYNASGRLERAARTIGCMAEDSELITLAVAAAETGYTPDRLRQMARKDGLPAEKYGNTWVIERGKLRQYMSEHKPTRGRPRGSRNKPSADH